MAEAFTACRAFSSALVNGPRYELSITSPPTAPAHPGPAHTTNPTRWPRIAQIFYECYTLPILLSRVSHSCAGQPFSVTSNGADEEKVAQACLCRAKATLDTAQPCCARSLTPSARHSPHDPHSKKATPMSHRYGQT